MTSRVPNGWTSVRASDVCSAIPNGSTPKADRMATSGEIPFVKVYNLTFNGALDFTKNPTFIDRDTHEKLLRRSRGRPGDVLMNIVGPPLGKVSILPDTFPEWNFNQAIVAFRVLPDRIDNRFLAQYLIHESASWASRFSKATVGQHNLAVSDCREIEIPLPPLNEQRRIVAKLEALQSRSRRAREALDSIPPLLEKLRQSILAAAFRGDLTKDWRAKHPDVEPADLAIERAPMPVHAERGRATAINVRPGRCAISVGNPQSATPKGWRWVLLQRVARMESGHTPSRAVDGYWNGGIPWVSIPDARDHNARTLHATTSTITDDGLANSAARLLPQDTVCLVRTAASIGYVTILGREMATSQDFANWVCGPALLPKFLMYALWAERTALRSFGEGSAHPTIYFPELKAFHLKLAPVEEQREIIKVIEQRLSSVERIRASFEEAARRQSKLDPAILAKAFRGQLVPQEVDSADFDPSAAAHAPPEPPASRARRKRAGKRAS